MKPVAFSPPSSFRWRVLRLTCWKAPVTGKKMTYREHLPGRDLRKDVRCFWTSRHAGLGWTHQVVPDGCMDVVVDVGRARAWLVGAMSVAQPFTLEADAEFVGVRFHPGGAAPFLGRLAASDLIDQRVDLGELWNRDAVERLCSDVAGHGRETDWVAGLEDALSKRRRLSSAMARTVPPWFRKAAALLEGTAGHQRITPLGSRFGVSRQHLTRVFREQTGLGPKQFARIFQLRRSLAEARRRQAAGREILWCDLALEYGYCDQSHLIGACRELNGLSPVQYLSTLV